MDRDSKESLNLIEAFRLQEVLWNPKHPSYFSKNTKHDAWAYYRREKAKVKKSYGTGKADKNDPMATVNSENTLGD
ncbi:MADF domain-containing protein [Aphis craccivora]|uniref:MADF domain-containing protein n=1 Tax=Aphis craccivora TaxID=307492 RepID=A0A6G0YIG5_APHCR|nr:MADF domain-containing protein [Aphis craccivora]